MIEYKSIVMRCDQINESACLDLSAGVEIEFFQKGMEDTWIEIQRKAGEFAGKSDEEVRTYFSQTFGNQREELRKRCIFLKEKNADTYIGTCMAWFKPRGKEKVSVLHWLAVDQQYAGKGYARMLITQVLRLFSALGEDEKIYLHTQPSSYKAIKLYNDFGFSMARTDTYAETKNEYEEAMGVLRRYMTKDSYEKLEKTSVE